MENLRTNYLIYGAYGYTGEIICRLAKKRGHQPILAGRDEAKLKPLANELGFQYHCFDLADTSRLESVLSTVNSVLHCAGPYSFTAQPMVNACIKTKTNYLDITGEIEVFEWIATQDQAAKEAGISLIPGVGFDVVPTDCLSAYLKKQLPDATKLDLGIKAIGELSRGTTLTVIENIDKGGKIRENGQIKNVPTLHLKKEIPVKNESLLGVSIPWGDVSTAYYSTKISNIVVYMVADKKMLSSLNMSKNLGWLLGLGFIKNMIKSRVRKTMTGPSETHRETARSYVWGQVSNSKGERKSAFLETAEGYKLTAESSVLCVEKVLKGDIAKGFLTPSLAFGEDLVLEISGSTRGDL